MSPRLLVNQFNEILLAFGTSSLKQDPVEFERKFEVLTQMWRDLQREDEH
jgi:hypothetical protein